jgi:Bacterial archaeo-eukaryotic release factor family 11
MPKHIDIPSQNDVKQLMSVRAEACASIYLPTSPLPTEANANRIEFKTLGGVAVERLHSSGTEKHAVTAIQEGLAELDDDEAFWLHQARSLAVFITPDSVRSFRLPNNLTELVEVSDRLLVKPLLRAVTFPQAAYVLALSVNAARLLVISPEGDPVEVKVPEMPPDAVSAVGLDSLKDNDPTSRTQGDAGRKLRLKQYAHQVDRALVRKIGASDLPLILAATQPLESIFRATTHYPRLAPTNIEGNPDERSDAQLADAARKVLDLVYAKKIEDLKGLYELRAGHDRATTDLTRIARAATFGAIDVLMVDIDVAIDGTVDPESGQLQLDETDRVSNYGVVDEIAKRVIDSGGRVLAVRREQVPGEADAAAILRFAV